MWPRDAAQSGRRRCCVRPSRWRFSAMTAGCSCSSTSLTLRSDDSAGLQLMSRLLHVATTDRFVKAAARQMKNPMRRARHDFAAERVMSLTMQAEFGHVCACLQSSLALPGLATLKHAHGGTAAVHARFCIWGEGGNGYCLGGFDGAAVCACCMSLGFTFVQCAMCLRCA